MKNLINFVAFQIGWFAAVLGPARHQPWLGLLVVPLVLLIQLKQSGDKWKLELKLAAAAASMGLIFDTTMTALGAFTPTPYGLPCPFSPLWMIMLWINQATTINGCMAWLNNQYKAAALFGALGGPLAYLGGAKLGAAAIPTTQGLAILSVAWAVAFPALIAVGARLRHDKRTAPTRL